MRVKLIQVTQNPIDVMWTAARTCYSEKSPVEMWEESCNHKNTSFMGDWQLQDYMDELRERTDKHWNLVKKVLDSGHQSIAEHVYFTFAIEGISRACSHQLVRHRAGIVFSQQSQRYVEFKDGNFSFVYPDCIEKSEDVFSYDKCIEHISHVYNYMIQKGMKAEDARSVLPNATKTNITMSVNFRELIHLCNLRLCTRAQKEIRDLFKEIVKCVKEVDERLASYLVPACEVHGVCQEKMCCGRKPKFEDVMKVYMEEKDNMLSAQDVSAILNPNPQVNTKLSEFMKQPNVLDK